MPLTCETGKAVEAIAVLRFKKDCVDFVNMTLSKTKPVLGAIQGRRVREVVLEEAILLRSRSDIWE
jgi:hypothetical protein